MTHGPEKAQPGRPARHAGVTALLAASVGVAVVGALGVGSFHREYGDITTSGLAQGVRPGLVIAVLAAFPASLAVALRPRVVIAVTAALVVLTAGLGTMAATQRGVASKEAAMPRSPSCTSGDASEEVEPQKASAATELQEEGLRYGRLFAELPSPGRFGHGRLSVDGCGAQLVDVGAAEAYTFYERELTDRGWTITERAPGEMLTATRAEYSFSVGLSVTDGSPFVEVYRTDARLAWLSAGRG